MSRLTTVATWNLEWARPGTPKGLEIRRRLFEVNAKVACLTETDKNFLGDSGFTVCSGEDYGYSVPERRRKVILWSERPWSSVDSIGHPDLPSGRFVSAVTETEIGEVQFTGVCIPWSDAHVRTGGKNRKRWEDHHRYLVALREFLSEVEGPHVVLGDFNQTIPRTRAPKSLFEELVTTFQDGFTVCTEGTIQGQKRPAIDHIACSSEFSPSEVTSIAAEWEGGKRLSDHFGVVVKLALGES